MTGETKQEPSRLEAALAEWKATTYLLGLTRSDSFAHGYVAGYEQARKDAEAAMAKALEGER